MPTYVALDLETTGTDPDGDAIIEVGAVRFDPEGPCQTFQSLVNPRRPIPYRIQLLTGITQAEVDSAPLFSSIALELEDFLGDAPLVGQNVAFDLAFLARRAITPSWAFDTFELASLLLPEASEYSLRALTQQLGVEFPVQHRALADAEATRQVFLSLRRRLGELPAPLLWEMLQLSSAVDWPLRRLLEEVARERLMKEGEAGGAVRAGPREPAPRPGGSEPVALAPREQRLPVDPSQSVATIRSAAVRPDALPGFEERPEQLRMAAAVAEAFNRGGQLLVEAGTGIGKSLAYLAPAALYALRNGTRVVVSTDTISLQEQLMGKDIPVLRALLGEELRAAQLKGRRNYLCLLRWAMARRTGAASVPEARLLVRLLLWADRTETGDRAELNLGLEEQPLWDRLSAQNENCLAGPCSYVKSGSCFLLRARRRAEAAHLVVVNHALLLSDVATGGGHVIPEYDHLILDEAHNLEEEATQQFGFQVTRGSLEEFLESVAPPSAGRRGELSPGGTVGGSLVVWLRATLRGSPAALAPAAPLEGLAAELQAAANRTRGHLPALFGRLHEAVDQLAPEDNGHDRRLLITRGVRAQPLWSQVELAWENVSLALGRLEEALSRLATALTDWGDTALVNAEGLLSQAGGALQTALQLRTSLGDLLVREDPERIAWLAGNRRGDVTVAGAPLRVDDILRQQLFERKETAILTGATLTAQGSFDYLRERVGLEEAEELLLGSPFDYDRAAMLVIAADMPEPGEAGYQAAVEGALVELCRASGGRALALFTSHAAVRATRRGVGTALEREGILVQAQGIDGSPKQLLATLRSNPRTVILGTASLWEGVDVVGEALSLLVIAKLPFAVPTDPIFAARSQLFEEPFARYALPQAVLRFKQGFGRLIRSHSDRGVAVVLDRRIASRGYGRAFLDSLPPCTVRRLALREMPTAVASWLAEAGP